MALPSVALETDRRSYRRKVLALDDERFVHEPRALWTVQTIQAAASAASISTARVVCPKDDFRNVTQYPITLTKLLVCGINYTYRSLAPTANIAANQVHNAAAAMNFIKAYIAAPYSRPFAKQTFCLACQAAVPTGEPGMGNSPTRGYASGLFGLSRWRFDRPYRLPRKATMQFQLSGYNVPAVNGTGPQVPDAFHSMMFEEATTGRFYGDTRVRPYVLLPTIRTQSTGAEFYPHVTDIFPPDNFGSVNVGNALPNTFDAAGSFLSREFNKQETNRGQEWSSFTGFAVMIDQITYDDSIQNLPAPFSGNPISPLSMKVGVHARTANGGTNQDWWRPGAPLALVSPTQTPATVFQFDQPIVLGPGEELEVELEVPIGPSLVIGASGGPVQVRPRYNIGVSMTGYASVG